MPLAKPVPVLYESHMHTPLCRHASGEPEHYAAVAAARNLKGIIVTCHNPFNDGYAQGSRMYPNQFPDYVALVDRARQAAAPNLDVRLGLECDYSPGFEPFLTTQLASADFHHVLGSVHPQVTEYRKKYDTATPFAYQQLYFDHLARAAESGLFDTLSHPDLVKNIYPSEWQLERIMPFIQRALDRIAKTGVAMELNTSGRNKEIAEINPGPMILQEIQRRGIPVVIGSDAHVPGRVGDHWEQSLALMASLGFTHVSFFLQRKRQDIPIPVALASLVRPA